MLPSDELSADAYQHPAARDSPGPTGL